MHPRGGCRSPRRRHPPRLPGTPDQTGLFLDARVLRQTTAHVVGRGPDLHRHHVLPGGHPIDPLADLRTSTAPNKAEQIQTRIAQLHLDQPVIERYLNWLKGASGCLYGNCDLGSELEDRPDDDLLLSGAVTTTMQLVRGRHPDRDRARRAVGLISALRQYTGFDYSITFLCFLLYSLPVFWVAVLAKDFLAIDFNDFLGSESTALRADDHDSRARRGITVSSAIAGAIGTRLRNFGIAAGIVAILIALPQHQQLLQGAQTPRDRADHPHLGRLGVRDHDPQHRAAQPQGALLGAVGGGAGRDPVAAAAVLLGLGQRRRDPRLATRARDVRRRGSPSAPASATPGAVPTGPLRPHGGADGHPGVGDVLHRPAAAELGQLPEQPADQGPARSRPSDATTPNLEGDFWIHTLDTLTHLLLPTIALILISFATYTRYTRASMLEVMNQDYIRTARSKGLTERTVIMRHAFRNALHAAGLDRRRSTSSRCSAARSSPRPSSLVRHGHLFVDSLTSNQQDPVMAYILIVAIFAVIANFVADLIYAVLDPRIRVAA